VHTGWYLWTDAVLNMHYYSCFFYSFLGLLLQTSVDRGTPAVGTKHPTLFIVQNLLSH